MIEEDSSAAEEIIPGWLERLLKTKFWEPCAHHVDANRGGDCLFCLFCYTVICPHCTHVEPGHRLLKVRRYVYLSVVLAKDMQELNVDVSRVQGNVDVNPDDFSGPEAERRYRNLQANLLAPPAAEPEPEAEPSAPEPADAPPVANPPVPTRTHFAGGRAIRRGH